MTTLSIDPGLTTGLAIFDRSDNLVGSRSVPYADLEGLRPWLTHIGPEFVVIERLPLRLQPNLARVVAFFDSLYPDAAKIGPGEWKPLARTKHMKYPYERFPNATIHERDAFQMGMFYIRFRKEQNAVTAKPYSEV